MSRYRPNRTLRRRMLLSSIVVGAIVIVGRCFQLQVLQHSRWTTRAMDQQHEHLVLPPERGTIYDRNGIPLTAHEETFRISVAPRELRDPEAVRTQLQTVLGIDDRIARRATSTTRAWVVIPGRYSAAAKGKLEGIRGIYFERILGRVYPHGDLGIEILGRMSLDGRALGGIEARMDSVLRGTPGKAMLLRDGRGRRLPGPPVVIDESVPGNDVYLTIDYHLQEIASHALWDAVESNKAHGGDLIILDPRTGEILAAASHYPGWKHWRGVTDPYEPGSTAKPFLLATLLAEGKVRLDEVIAAENGRWTHEGRTITDVHGYDSLTVQEALVQSSNVVMAKLAQRLDRDQQHAYLSAFGFGQPTGIPYPAESGGLLRKPERWSKYSQASLAIGYEMGVTPLQMALAYGAIANGGVLMEPRLIREVRTKTGTLVDKQEPRAVRQVIPESVARQIARVLRDAVQNGTGAAASLGAEYEVAGKTGTARKNTDGRYAGGYVASFAGFFPANNPQLVFIVRIDRPQGGYYGGVAAAPVTRAVLTAALAAHSAWLDRTDTAEVNSDENRNLVDSATAPTSIHRIVLTDDVLSPSMPSIPQAESRVPEIAGLSTRDAILRLHAARLRVRAVGTGIATSTNPATGTPLPMGTTVVLHSTPKPPKAAGLINGL